MAVSPKPIQAHNTNHLAKAPPTYVHGPSGLSLFGSHSRSPPKREHQKA